MKLAFLSKILLEIGKNGVGGGGTNHGQKTWPNKLNFLILAMHSAQISSKSLFHFTRNIDNLKGILKEGFQVRFSLESIEWLIPPDVKLDKLRQVWIPMVCFCDIPLKQTSEHLGDYGFYGIGLNKNWAISKGASPILYLFKDSPIAKSLNRNITVALGHKMKEAINFLTKGQEEKLPEIFHTLNLVSFVKPFHGFNRNGQSKEFYNEREWRYVPEFKLNEFSIPFIPYEERYSETIGLLAPENLKFEVKDIDCIVVKSQVDRDEILKFMNDKFGDTHTVAAMDRLKSKVFCLEEDLSNF